MFDFWSKYKSKKKLDARAAENLTGRIEFGVGIEDTFSLDYHIAQVIVKGLEHFPASERKHFKPLADAMQMYLSKKHYMDLAEADKKAFNKGMKQLVRDFQGLWW